MEAKGSTESEPEITARTSPLAGCGPCAGQGSTEWTLRTQHNSGIITSVHETTATCHACNQKQTFQNRKPTVVGKLLAAITRMLPEPPEARPGRQSANEEPEPAAAN